MTDERRITQGEVLVASLTLAIALADALLIARSNVRVAAGGYVASALAGGALIALGQVYRRLGRSAEIAATAMVAGWLIWFTAALSTFNYLMLPLTRPPIDAQLVGLDAALGWRWADMVAFGARRPEISAALAFVYDTSLVQIAVVIVALGLAGAQRELDRFAATLCVSACLTIGFWTLFPSLGPSTLVAIDPETARQAGLLVGPDYGRELLRLAAIGPDRLSLDDAQGLVAFPSFHTVLAAMCVWHARRIRWLGAIIWPLNLLMPAAILLHGGHHLVDLPAGLATFALAAWASERLTARAETRPASPSVDLAPLPYRATGANALT